jgi:hypothetical protein
MKRLSCYFALFFSLVSSQISAQSLFTFEDHFDSVTSSSNWHHTQDYRGGGVFEVVDGQFKRTTPGFVFYYNDSFTSGAGIYEFKAKGWWNFLWRGSTNSTSGRVLTIRPDPNSAEYLDYYEVTWSGYDHQYHNGSILRQERKFVGQYLRDSMNTIKIVDIGDSAKIYVNDILIHNVIITPDWRQDGYIEIGAAHQADLTAFDDITIKSNLPPPPLNFIYENHFDSIPCKEDWHHTQDYRGGGVFEVVDGQFKRTTPGFVFYYNDSFVSGKGTYEFKACGWWVFLWRGSTSAQSGRVVLIGSAGSSAQYLDYDEVIWSGYDHQYHNGTILRQERKLVGQYLRDSLNSIKIVDTGDSAKIYVNNVLIHNVFISPDWRQDGYIEIGANSQTDLTVFDDFIISPIIDSSEITDPRRFRIPLTITENSEKTRTLYWGKRNGAQRGIWLVDPNATIIDSVEGEKEEPPAPPDFDARFTGVWSLYGGGSLTDIRGISGITQVDTYRVRVQKSDASSSVLFLWPKELVKEMYKGHVILYRSSTSKPINVNMKLSDSFLYVFDEGENSCYLYILAQTSPIFEVNFERGWNLVSTVNKAVQVKNTPLFPNLISKAYSFDPISGYKEKDTLYKGTGYWIKLNDAITSVCDTNEIVLEDTISVHEGWNLIGSVAEPTPVNTIGSIPANMVTSNFFAYSNGYYISDTLQPMKAYWVLVNQVGQLILSATSTSSSSNQIRMVTSSDLPPAPPSDEIMSVIELPTKYSLEQAYPNPFNPITKIKYQLPEDTRVIMKVFNILGEEIKTIVNGFQSGGYKEIAFNGEALPSGFYFYQLQTDKFTDVKKMLLVK